MMKKLSLYIFLVLMWCNVGFAELIIFSDIKVGEKVSKYINDQQVHIVISIFFQVNKHSQVFEYIHAIKGFCLTMKKLSWKLQ